MHELRRQLERTGYAPVLTATTRAHLTGKLQAFTSALNAFFKSNKTMEQTMLAVAAAHDLRDAMALMEETIRPLRDALVARDPLPPDMGRLELVFNSDPTVPNVRGKLRIFAELYAEALRRGQPLTP